MNNIERCGGSERKQKLDSDVQNLANLFKGFKRNSTYMENAIGNWIFYEDTTIDDFVIRCDELAYDLHEKTKEMKKAADIILKKNNVIKEEME